MRWFTLTENHLKAAGYGTIIDRARTLASGTIDPAQEAIDNATARVLRAIAPGNDLDADATKIPGSFKGVAEKLALYDLMERIGLARTADQTKNFEAIINDLNRTADNKLKVEHPDTPAATGQIQPTGMQVQAVDVPRRHTGHQRTAGL